MKKALFTVAIAAIIGAVPLASSYAEESISTTTTTTTAPTTTTTTTVVPTTTTAPVVTTTTLSPAQIKYLEVLKVNSMVYNHDDPVPAMAAYRIVARHRGWTPSQIKSWETAIANIMMGESGFCPNVLRGAVLANPKGCVLKRQGRYSDAGFGQLIGIHYRLSKKNPGAGWLCREEGLCSKWQIINSPYQSMTALLALIERSGTKGWCYNRAARRYHRIACNNPGMNVG
jgi:hypothetical protein